MATLDIRVVDIPFVLYRLRPTASYHWKGNGSFGNLYSAIGEWRDAGTTPPTEAEILQEWDVYLAEQEAEAVIIAAIEADKADVRAAQIQAALDQITADIATLGSSPSNAVVLQIIGRCLQRQARIIKALRHLV